jgi:hypothetical protein
MRFWVLIVVQRVKSVLKGYMKRDWHKAAVLNRARAHTDSLGIGMCAGVILAMPIAHLSLHHQCYW